jgi:hypothetical protein
MTDWQTIQINSSYSFVTTISTDGASTKSFSDLAALQAVIDNLWSTRPIGYVGVEEYCAINIYKNSFGDWQAKNVGEEGFRTDYLDLDISNLQLLADECWA